MEDRSLDDRAGIYARWIFETKPFFGEHLCIKIPSQETPGAPRRGAQRPSQEPTQDSPPKIPPVGRPPTISALVPQLGLSHMQSIYLLSLPVSEHCCHVRFTIKDGIMFCCLCKVTNAQCTVTIGELDSFVKASFTSLIQSMRSPDFLHGRGINVLTTSGTRQGKINCKKNNLQKKTIASASDNRDIATPMRGSATGQAWNCYRASDP